MKHSIHFVLAASAITLSAHAALPALFGDPPDDTHPWAKHDPNRPQPPRVEPGEALGDAPSDAVVLFDGTEASMKANWEYVRKDRKADWEFKDGAMQSKSGAGYIKSKAEFGDCQLHIEWAAPTPPKGNGQGRGNSGVFLMGIAEVQVLDNYDNPTYADGTAGAVYGVMPPMVNPLHKPGKWQSYDIVFRRPITKDGQVVDQGSLTVFVNGVLVQDSTPLEGGGGYKWRSRPIPYPEKGSFPEVGALFLQDHGNPVRFRNIWYREIRKRPVDGGTDGQLSVDATLAKRAEIAADILQDAKTKSGLDRLLRMLESQVYHANEEVLESVNAMSDAYVKKLGSLGKDKVAKRKGEVMKVYHAFKYVKEHGLNPGGADAFAAVEEIVYDQGWRRRR